MTFFLSEIIRVLLLLLLSRFSRVWLLAAPWTAAYQAPPSLGFSRQKYWRGVPLPSPGLYLKEEMQIIFQCNSGTQPDQAQVDWRVVVACNAHLVVPLPWCCLIEVPRRPTQGPPLILAVWNLVKTITMTSFLYTLNAYLISCLGWLYLINKSSHW